MEGGDLKRNNMSKVRELISDALYWVSWKLELLADWINPVEHTFTEEQKQEFKEMLMRAHESE